MLTTWCGHSDSITHAHIHNLSLQKEGAIVSLAYNPLARTGLPCVASYRYSYTGFSGVTVQVQVRSVEGLANRACI